MFEKDTLSALQARDLAQRIAFGPIVFHAALALRDMGILEGLLANDRDGRHVADVAADAGISVYGATVLLESGLGAGLVLKRGELFFATKAAHFVVHDEMTRVNLNFVRDVCYRGAEDLQASIIEGRAAGLHHLADTETVYEALGDLAEPARTSWFDFDHYYSSAAFPALRPRVLENSPKRLLDVGGNTGKWSCYLAKGSPDIQVTILDHPNQLQRAAIRAENDGVGGQVSGVAMDLLDHSKPFPRGVDGVWMSQFLCCFSEADCAELVRRAREALNDNGELFILDTFWDKQRYEAATFSLQQTSLYFTFIANGTSRMYSADALQRCVYDAGMHVVEEVNNIGTGHTFWRCRKRA